MEDIINMKVVGIGGAGNSVVSRMKSGGTTGVGYCVINTGRSFLSGCAAEEKLVIGEKVTKGQGAGSQAEIGRLAAEESQNAIQKLFDGVDAVFLTAGMGGGTGTGAIPLVAEAARSAGALTVGVVSLPFRWEGARKMHTADLGVQALLKQVDTLFVIPNDNLRKVAAQNASFADAFAVSDEVLIRAVGNIADLLRSTAFINLDFADLKTVLQGGGIAHLGIGEASGKNKVEEAVSTVIHSDLMDTDIQGARRLIINFICSNDLTLDEVFAVMERIRSAAHEDANIIFGIDFDDHMVDALRLVVIATDFGERFASAAANQEEVEGVVEKQRSAPPVTGKVVSDDDWDALWKRFFEN